MPGKDGFSLSWTRTTKTWAIMAGNRPPQYDEATAETPPIFNDLPDTPSLSQVAAKDKDEEPSHTEVMGLVMFRVSLP